MGYELKSGKMAVHCSGMILLAGARMLLLPEVDDKR